MTLFAGDLSNAADVAAALAGVTRAMLVSGAFSYEQFEVEALFIEAAARANLEVTVRVSTHSGLIKAGTKGAYGRTHHGLEAFIAAGKYKVVVRFSPPRGWPRAYRPSMPRAAAAAGALTDPPPTVFPLRARPPPGPLPGLVSDELEW